MSHSPARRTSGSNIDRGNLVGVSGVNGVIVVMVMVIVVATARGGVCVGFDFGLGNMHRVIGSLPSRGLYSSNFHAILLPAGCCVELCTNQRQFSLWMPFILTCEVLLQHLGLLF